jgi:hypothetical protein
LYSKYSNHGRINFLGSIYNKEVLNNLRYYSYIYFHGHSVGGTNPSLLEAMGCSCFIFAHNNEFNKSVLENNAYYFNTPEDLAIIIDNSEREQNKDKISSNITKINDYYNSDNINNLYEKLFIRCIQEK